MFPFYTGSLRIWVAESCRGVASELSGNGTGEHAALDVKVEVETLSPERWPDGGSDREPPDCVLVPADSGNGGDADIGDVIAETPPEVPVIAVVADGSPDAVAGALEAGVTETLPRALFESDPDTARGRVRSVVQRERARVGYREVYDRVAGTVSVHDPETGELVHANQSLCDLLGYDRETLLSMRVGDFTADVPGYDHERAMGLVRSTAATGDPVEIEWPLETAAGEVRWTDSCLERLRIGGRELVLSVSADITERRRRERAYEQVFDNVNDAITVHDPWEREMVDVNDGMCEMTGTDETALLEMDVDGISADGDRDGDGVGADEFYEIMGRVAGTGDPETVEWHVRTATGEVRILESKLTPATLAGEDRVLALSRDVTDRRDRRRRLRAERDRRSVLFENNPDPVVRVEFEDGEPYIREVNPAFERVFGFEESSVVGATVEDILVPEGEREGHRRARERAVAGEPVEMEVPRLTADGTREFRFRVIHFGVDQRSEDVSEAYVWYTDVTDRRRRERAIAALQDATERMHGAETAEEVAETAVEAAREALDLPLTMCWFHDADGSRLAPVIATDAVHEAGLWSPLSDDRYEYDVFREGQVTTYSPREHADHNPLETAVLLPLGEHGLLAAGRRDRADYDDVTLDVARTLAEHTTTALDRVERATEVRESERRFRLIAERIDQVIFLATPDFSEVFYVNDAYEEIWGQPVRELLEDPRGFIEYVDPRDRETFEDEFEEMIAEIERGEGRDSYEFEFRVRRPDGEIRWVRATGYPAGFEGDDRRFVGIVEDVTERRELERTYRAVFENVSDGLVVHDPETGEIVDVNDRYCEMNGYDRETLIGSDVGLVTAPGEEYSYEGAEEMIERAREEGPQLFEWRNKRGDGETFPVEVHLSVVEIRGEERVLASVRDITERKRREREYEQIFDGVTDAITIHDPETGEILDVNETTCELTGYDREALLGDGMERLNVASEGYSSERAREIIREVMETDEPRTLEWLIERADGDQRWFEVNATPATLNGERRYLAIMRDVTDQRRTERRLRAILDRIDEAIFLTRAAEITEASQEPDYLSSGYEEIWGQSLEAIRDRYEDGFFGTLHPEDEPDYRAFVERIVADVAEGDPADSYTTEYRIERPEGDLRWVKSDYYPIEWDSGPPRIVIVSRDVTGRKKRERRIASFEEATDDLATADDREEAARLAVRAATEDLGLSTVGAFLYDDDEGVLEPEALSDAVPAALEDRAVGPGGGPLWEAFATGSVVDSDSAGEPVASAGSGTAADSDPTTGGDADSGGEAAAGGAAGNAPTLADWRAIALGSHGVLLVGSPGGSIEPDTLQAAHILAATLEAALNHLRGQQRLADQEEQLRTQTERAERLDRIVTLTQQVEAAINEASDPTGVERAVCERLAGTGPYEAAWIGGVEVGTDHISPRSVVGTSKEYVDGLDLTTTDGPPDQHPAIRAWTTDDPAVAESLVEGGPSSDWRRGAISEGHQSLCAVPLTYDGITHGVLTVAAGSPGAFGDRERDVLAQLGTSIGYALAAIERRRALESDETVELEFAGPGTGLRFARAAATAGCEVRHERTVPREGGEVSVYFAFDGEAEDAAAVAEETLPGDVDVVADGPGSVLVEAVTDDWFGSPLAEYGAVLREASATPDGATIVVELSAGADVRSFTDRLEGLAPSLELVAKRQHQRRERTAEELHSQVEAELTDRQYEVLTTALSAGYFEWPRESDGGEVAERLGITQPTFNKHLRLGERKTFELLFGRD